MSYEVRVDPGVSRDLRELAAEQQHVRKARRLSTEEAEEAISQAIRLIQSLRENPLQGERLTGGFNQRILAGCRRLKFDPANPPPRDSRGRVQPRMRLVWVNEPEESSVALVRVLAATHRDDSRPYRRAATRLGEARRGKG